MPPSIRRNRPFQSLVPGDSNLFRFARLAVLFSLLFPPALATAESRMRELKGRHITILTDLPREAAVDELPQVFDQAIPQWADFFRVERTKFVDWHLQAYVMRNEGRFRNEGLLPADLPPFLHGYQRGKSLWVREQPSPYYQRHLLLHEGTHAFMRQCLGGTGAPWYMEGVAELLATHRWEQGQLQLKLFPRSRDEVPLWGRIKLVRDSVASGRVLSLQDVFQLEPKRFLTVSAYAWSWAAAAFLDGHPDYRPTFAEIQSQAALPPAQFSAELWRRFEPKRGRLNEAWQLFLADLDYGYVIEEDQILYRSPTKPLTGPVRLEVATHLGWQSTGIELIKGGTYRIQARGRYQVVTGPETWPCGPQGVTIRYHNGLPKGMLVGAILGESGGNDGTPLANPLPLGRDRTWKAERDGVLFLRINEPAGQRSDNRGALAVQIANKQPAPTD
jgi:hypothetical protein